MSNVNAAKNTLEEIKNKVAALHFGLEGIEIIRFNLDEGSQIPHKESDALYYLISKLDTDITALEEALMKLQKEYH